MKDVEFDLVRNLVLPIMGVVLVRLHNLFIVPEREQAEAKVLQQLWEPGRKIGLPLLPQNGVSQSFAMSNTS